MQKGVENYRFSDLLMEYSRVGYRVDFLKDLCVDSIFGLGYFYYLLVSIDEISFPALRLWFWSINYSSFLCF